MKYLIILVILMGCSLFLKAQTTYSTIGVTSSWYIPETSQPIHYNGDNAVSGGIFGEHYFKNHFKLKVGVNYYLNAYNEKFLDTSKAPKIYTYNATEKFITLPFEAAYNFMRGDEKWEFFVDAGYVAFIHLKTHIGDFTNNYTLTPYNSKLSYRNAHYFTVGFSGRYKFTQKWLAGFGTKSYHFLPVINKESRGFPSISIDVSMAYAF